MKDPNIGRPYWHESYVLERLDTPEQKKSTTKRLFKAIGNVASNITRPTIDRINTTREFFEALPNHSSTPEQITQFENKYIQPVELQRKLDVNVQSPPNEILPTSDIT